MVEKNVEDIRKNKSGSKKLKEIFVGSILDLSQYKDESFDVVLNLGSYYHLTDIEKRNKSLEESLRVLKKGGIYAVSYINKLANIIKFRSIFVEDFNLVNEYLEKGYHRRNKIFFASHPEDVKNEIKSKNVDINYNIATDGVKFIIQDTINNMDEDKFNKWMDYHLKTCEDKSIIGLSEHGLIIGRKK